MPRLSTSILRHAASCNTHLPRLLRECRDLESATNEVRWLAEHAHNDKLHIASSPAAADARLMQYVRRRSKGEPLQYILGNQPFGKLEILCRKNVLIPRPETEQYTTTIAELIRRLCREGVIADVNSQIRIADLCTGSGCIALLLHASLRPSNFTGQEGPALKVCGVDISSHAMKLARDNLQHNLGGGVLNVSCNGEITFEFLDVLKVGEEARRAMCASSDDQATFSAITGAFFSEPWDVIVSNPPYISPLDYAPGGTVGRSVRDHEPKLALVPPPLTETACGMVVDQADQFYEAILHTARQAQTKLLVMEIGDANQASRVRRMATEILSSVLIETWRDDGRVDCYPISSETQSPTLAHERAVVVWAADWMKWRLSDPDHR